jgi:hypothetical protein
MTTYYDYIRERVLVASVGDQAQLEHVIHVERSIFWQRLVTNPAYDERGRLAALAQFDEAAGAVFTEQAARFNRQPHNGFSNNGPLQSGPVHSGALAGAAAQQNGRLQGATQVSPREPRRRRSVLRDVVFLLLGVVIGFVAAYFAQDGLARVFTSASAAPAVQGLTASQKSFKLIRSRPSPLEGEVAVDYAGGARPEDYKCEVDATNKQVLEYVRFDSACKTVSFKFLPLPTLWDNFNYLEGYMVFSTTITSSSGKTWEGSASVYFKIDATA